MSESLVEQLERWLRCRRQLILIDNSRWHPVENHLIAGPL